MKTVKTDVLIVGTGFGAAAPALRLAEAGFRVRMIEKGPHIEPSKDFRQTQNPNYLRRYLKGYAGENISLLCGEGLGGGSGFYEMISLRAPTMAFQQRDAEGRDLWPTGLDRKTLDPFYDTAEELLHVRQLQPSQVPKTGLVFALMMKRLGYSCDLGRYASRGCIGSGFCVTGCIYGAKQSLHMNYLPLATQAGAVIETDTEALWINPIEAEGSARSGALSRVPHRYEVMCRRTESRERVRYLARLVVLGGGTVGTATLLLRSKKTLPALSPHVGRNIAFNGSVKTAGILADDLPDGDMFTGQSHPGVFSYEFLASHGVVVTAAKPLPLQAVASARLRLDGDTREPAYWGQPHVELMRRFRRRAIVLVAFGLTPPLAWIGLRGGRPEPCLTPTEGLLEYKKRTRELLHSLMRRNGCRVMDTEFVDREGRPQADMYFGTAHQVGSCRMAASPDRGVVDVRGEVFGYPGLYVSDGAAIPSSLAVNTSLTILANAERIAEGLVSRYAPASRRRVRSQAERTARSEG